MRLLRNFPFLALGLLITGVSAVHAAPAQETVIIFDASRSMHDPLENGTKLQAAKESLSELAGQIAPGTRAGLRVFGASPVTGDVRQSCFDSKLVMPVGPYDKYAMTARVMALEAHGQTALGYSLELAGKDFSDGPDVEKTIILISDGEESCGKDPVAVVKNLQAAGVNLKVHAIGFAVDPRTKAQLEQIAQLTGGSYRDAKSTAELKNSLQKIAGEEKIIDANAAQAAASQMTQSGGAAQKAADAPAEEAPSEMLLRAEKSAGENLLSAAGGARIISAANEDAAFAIDGSEETYASLGAGEQTVIAFKGNQPVLIESFALPIREESPDNPKKVHLSGSLDSPQTGFFSIGTVTFQNRVDFKDVYQQTKIDPPAAVRYLKVTAGEAFDSGYAAHAEWRVFGKFLAEEELAAHTAGRAETERNLAAREAGGVIAAATTDGFEPLFDGSGEEAGEEEVSIDAGSEVVISFEGEKTAHLTKLAVPIYQASDNNCRTFEIEASETSPSDGFTPAGSFQTANLLLKGKPFQEFTFPGPVKAKYLKVRFIDDHGDAGYCYLRELQVFGTANRTPSGGEGLQE